MCAVKTMVVLGSGGHTAEMLSMLAHVDRSRLSPRVYVTSSGDTLSEQKARTAELSPDGGGARADWSMARIPRSRHVGQSWCSSAVTCLCATFVAVVLLLRHRPSLLLANGPGTCVPLCVAACLLRAVSLRRWRVRVVYVESVCRVTSLSLSGRLLYRLVDRLVVQWPELAEKYPTASYLGCLV